MSNFWAPFCPLFIFYHLFLMRTLPNKIGYFGHKSGSYPGHSQSQVFGSGSPWFKSWILTWGRLAGLWMGNGCNFLQNYAGCSTWGGLAGLKMAPILFKQTLKNFGQKCTWGIFEVSTPPPLICLDLNPGSAPGGGGGWALLEREMAAIHHRRAV